jgi:hypothetical protein
MTQVQLAHTEAQRFALVQNVMEMQNQVAEMEIEVEVGRRWLSRVSSRRSPHQPHLPLQTRYREIQA